VGFLVARLVEVSEQLSETALCGLMAFDFSWPSAGGGVFDELLLDGEARV
jgi:hypothetical protein